MAKNNLRKVATPCWADRVLQYLGVGGGMAGNEVSFLKGQAVLSGVVRLL
jgi:hypothetical protein